MKRVLVIQPFLSYGGAEAVSVGIAKYLQTKGYETKVLALYTKKSTAHNLNQVKVLTPKFIDNILKSNKFIFLLLGFPILFFLVLKHSKDALLLNPHNFPTLWIAVIVGKLRNIPVYWTVHNFPQSNSDFMDKLFARNCQKIIAVSEKVKRQIHDKLGIEATVSHPAIDFKFYSQGVDIRKKLGWEGKKILLSVTRLKREKSINLLLSAFKKVKKKIKNAELVLVGEGDLDLRKQEGVTLLGYKNPIQIRDLYKSCDLVVLPSHKTEGFNLVPFEAGSAGIRSIVIRGSGADEVLEHEEIGFVSGQNSSDLAKRISSAIGDKKRLESSGLRIKSWIRKNLSEKNYHIYEI